MVQIGGSVLIVMSIMLAEAVLSLPTGRAAVQSVMGTPASVRISTPGGADRVRISMPSELFRGVRFGDGGAVDGAIEVPRNARAGIESARESAAARAAEEARAAAVAATPRRGAHGGGYVVWGGRGRVSGWRPTRHTGGAEEGGAFGAGAYAESGSIFDDTADDAHRRAQLRFHEASYPRLGVFEDAHRRAQLEFHRATLTPGGKRGSDGLRRERLWR